MRGLSVVIPSRNDDNLQACISAIGDNDPLVRLVVVDDGLRGEWEWTDAVKCVPGEKPFCFARNANIGIRAAGDDDVILLNDDALLETKGGFRAMWAESYKRPEYGLLSARTNAANHCLPYSLSFVCVLIRRDVFHAVGPLSEQFGEVYGGEDDDYCYRVRTWGNAGLKIGVFPDCFVDHKTLPSTFRGLNGSLPIAATRRRFFEIHGFEMRTR